MVMPLSDEDFVLAPVLIVSADSRTRQVIRGIFEGWDVPVDEAQDTLDAAEKLLFRNPHSAVICDESLPDGTAHDLFRLLLWQGMEMPFVVAVEKSWMRTSRSQNFRLLEKPLSSDALWEVLNDIMDGALSRYQKSLDAQDAAAWSRFTKPEDQTFLLCDGAELDQSVGRRNDPRTALFEVGG
jgi:DNA-binding NtrC family response regulator